MGIESDQLVFDYLSRVGDLAQQRQLPSGARMRLVSELRGEIERRRAKAADSPAAVRRILDRIGSPDDLVTAAAAPSAEAEAEREPVRPRLGRPRSERPRSERPRREVPRPRRAPEPQPPAPPHLAGTDELGDSAPDLEPDWWRVERVPEEGAHTVHGFVGGVEIPEMLRRPTADLEKKGPGGKGEEDEPEEGEATEDAEDAEYAEDAEDGDAGDEAEPEAPPRRRFGVLPSLTKSAPPAKAGPTAKEAAAKAAPGAEAPVPDGAGAGGGALAGVRSLSNPVLLLAAAALVVGAVIGNWFALGGGWVVAWFSRKLSPAEKKGAVIAVPALTIAGGIGWLWGRSQGKWGEPIVKGQMNAAVEDTWPWVVRVAAVASALFLVWRSQRSKPE
ncbi:hypothetical protein [Streptomyces spectabilis]|uniref:Uncharacterized protein n=1 Tax=Streptomyces spectabilis TaxID=68270 RepID=A0A516R983_STRST|nr:hypothetical protein [Streptomyces spectabilis]QDQ12217.1 hypothetical protein FH965_17875 [Streptomyces spectabilis]